MKKLKQILQSPFFLALVITLIVVLLMPQQFNKYELVVYENGPLKVRYNTRVYINDLDNDGNSEQVYSYYMDGFHSFQVFKSDGGMVEQWNANGEVTPRGYRLGFCDSDKDNFKEIYGFYLRNDTIFIYGFEPLDTINPVAFEDRMLCTVNRKYSEPDPDIINVKSMDVTLDGNEDLLVIVKSGQSKFPRNLFVFDIVNDSVFKSPDYGSIFENHWGFIDFENDGKPEIYGRLRAAGNIQPELGYKYNDYSAWLMVFNHDLTLRFDPIEFPGFNGQVEVYPVEINEEPLLACYYRHIGILDNFPKLFLVNGNGDIVNEYNFPKSPKTISTLLVNKQKDDVFFNIIDENGDVLVFNDNLELIDEFKFYEKGKILPHPRSIDLNIDGEEEFYFITKNNSLIVTNKDHDIQHIKKIDMIIGFSDYNLLYRKDKPPLLYLHDLNNYMILQYKFNPYYYYQYLIYLGVFGVLWLFILIIRKIQLIQIEKSERTRQQIVDLQLKSYRNQLDPHFASNVFNTMAWKIQQENPKSYDAFMEFSNLIRSSLLSSDCIKRSINEELSQIKSYLELEKLRFPEKISYSIIVDDDVDQTRHIPKLVLQTFVENSVKHGIKHKHESGKVEIKISKKRRYLLITITDDGIGRERSKEIKTHGTGFGLKIVENYFSLFNDYNRSKIKYNIIDLYDDVGTPSGTRVRIEIPDGFSYKLKK